jgi:hypothetical protein
MNHSRPRRNSARFSMAAMVLGVVRFISTGCDDASCRTVAGSQNDRIHCAGQLAANRVSRDGTPLMNQRSKPLGLMFVSLQEEINYAE